MPFSLPKRLTKAWSVALLLLRLFVGCVLAGGWVLASAQGLSARFDHLKTGFALTGAHASLTCESCHQKGVLKGTPRECSGCHAEGARFARGNVVMPSKHIRVTQGCEACHSTKSFVGGTFTHSGVVPGTCQSCHDGVHAEGKFAGHMATQQACDSCHKTTTSWSGAKVDHSSFNTSTQCASCHNGSTATGKPGAHIPVSANCISCHNVTGWKPTKWNHTQVSVTGQCSTCHSGAYPPAQAKPSNHIPYQSLTGVSTGNCDSCHKGGYASWTAAKFHSNVTVNSQCSTCHLTSAYGLTAKPNNPLHAGVTGGCESCHKTSGWSGAKVDHSTFNSSTQCASCHNGSTATGKPGAHIPVSANCISCHNVTGWKPTKWNHTQVSVTGQCSTCHSGAYPPAQAKPSNHIPYQSITGAAITNCDSCHKAGYNAWTPARFHSNVTVNSQCSTCHLTSAYGLTAKPNNPLHAGVTGGCESCHKTSGWSGAKVDHSTFNSSTQCASCHNGSTATGKPGAHIPVTANCISCHNVTGWKPTKWNHTQVSVTGQCSTCHSGAYPPAQAKPSNHIPYQSITGAAITNCDSCHKAGYNAWTPARFHSNVTVNSQCSTCHLTSAYGLTAKPNNPLHAGVTGGCESCHKTSGWSGAKVDHSTFNSSTQCASCHNGSTATGKPGAHIPVTANCISCHNVTGWKPTKWNHTQVSVTGQCSTCHSGAYPPAAAKPSNHIPYQSITGAAITNCDSCHKAGYNAWTPARFHSNVTVNSQCSTCHLTSAYGLTAKPNNPLHAGVTGGCESCHKTSGWSGAKVDHSTFNSSTQCASCHNGSTATGKPGAHIPVSANCISCHNVTGWKPTKWNHTQVSVTGQCSTCHSGAYPPAAAKPSNHIPYQSITGAAITNCDSCHKAGYNAWTPARFHSNVTVNSQCSTCHLTSAYGLTAKPNNPLHAGVTGGCESCHKTSGWSGAKVDHSTFNSSTQCASCHNGSTATGKPGAHIPVTANCISCHNVTGWKPTKWNHTQVSVTGQCSTCHSGAYPPAQAKPSNHIPYQSITGAAITNCDSCHKAGYNAWTPARFHSNVTVNSQCSTCHLTSAYGLTAKPNNAIHNGVVSNCESCHKSTSSWSNVTYTHATANAVGTGTCDTCHNGSTATGKPGNHIPIQVASVKCDTCHRSQVAWATSVTMNHSDVSTQSCKSCHTSLYSGSGALDKPNNHIPEAQLLSGSAMDCSSCHTRTTAGGFSSATMNHNNSQGNGSGWCYACHNSGTSYLGNMEKKALTHRSRTATDCSQSGCHRPLGNRGSTYRNWD